MGSSSDPCRPFAGRHSLIAVAITLFCGPVVAQEAQVTASSGGLEEVVVFLNGLGGGIFTAPNTAAIMSSVPAAERGAASGVRATFFNAGSSLSIGIFFSLMIIGLANTLPDAMSAGLHEQGVSTAVAHEVANTPPVGSLFAAFLGYNPIAELLAPYHALQQPGVNADVLTGKTFFPHLITEPFHTGLVVVFVAAAVMMVIGALASMFNPGRYGAADDD